MDRRWLCYFKIKNKIKKIGSVLFEYDLHVNIYWYRICILFSYTISLQFQIVSDICKKTNKKKEGFVVKIL